MHWSRILLLVCALGASVVDARCEKWAQTHGCDPIGARQPEKDADCSTTIKKGRSGYCDCGDRIRARPSTCDHHPFDCNTVCEKEVNANLKPEEGYTYVTCGSTIKLVHESTRYRLHSHEVNYGSGSGQQSVTAHSSHNDPNSYWLVKEGHDETPCSLGAKIKCGDKIRLEHISTRRNLHTHGFRSPLSSNQEVSCFGVAGDGDSSDTWILDCEEAEQCDAVTKECEEGVWKRDALVRLKAEKTHKYLYTNAQNIFDDSNCPRCPINGQLEISSVSSISDDTMWYAAEGIYMAPQN